MIDVSAIDKDSGPNAQISYTFSSKTGVRFLIVKCFWVYVQFIVGGRVKHENLISSNELIKVKLPP